MLKKIKNEFVSKEFLANLVLLAIIRRQVININMKKFFSLCCVYIVLHSFNLVHAEEPKFIEVYKDWYVFTLKQKETKVCYLSSLATKSKGNYTKRGDVLFMVTHRVAKSAPGEINFRAGYKFKKNTKATITINQKKFTLFTQGSDGWAKDSKTDNQITQAMIRGSQMIVVGVSSRGTETTDTFSLSGFTAAHKAARKACKIK